MKHDPDFSEIAQIVEARTGIKAEGVGELVWQRSIRRRMEECLVSDVRDYARLVRTSPGERQQLVELIVVPETWFFRDRQGLEFFLKQVLEEEKRGRRKPWHILSLGCATGEEPYSIALTLLQGGIPLLRFSVEGVDISHRALEHARKGVYGARAFRGASILPYRRYFAHTEKGSEIRADVRQRVAFRRANITDPAFGFNARKYDFIFCRNVLIYFSSEVQDRVLKNASQLLEKGGYLLLSPTESELVRLKGHPHAGPRLACAHQIRPVAAPMLASLSAKVSEASVTPPSRSATYIEPKKRAPNTGDGLSADLAEAQRLANEGQLDSASALCKSYLKNGNNEPAVYYLLGAVKMAQHSDDEAEEYFHKAVYLAPTHYDALVNLALIAERKGRNEEARRYWSRARKCSTEPFVERGETIV